MFLSMHLATMTIPPPHLAFSPRLKTPGFVPTSYQVNQNCAIIRSGGNKCQYYQCFMES